MLRKITVNPTWDMETLIIVAHDGQYDYWGEVIENKGDPTAQAAETSQLNFDNTLQSIFQSQYANQTATLNYLKNQAEPIIEKGGVGYSGADLAAARTSATDTISSQYQNAEKSANAIGAAHGGDALPSGVNSQIDSSILQGEASDISGAQNSITAQNEQLKQANYWNAINTLNGTAAQFNPLGYAQNANSAASTIAQNSEASAYTNANSFSGELGRAFAGTFGGALGTATAGLLA